MLEFIAHVEKVKIKGRYRQFSKFKCDCGNVVVMRYDNVKYGKSRSCRQCIVVKLKDLPKKISGLTVIKDLGMNNDNPKKRIAVFKCFCGILFISRVNNIKSGSTKSCGCLSLKPNNYKHGLIDHQLYRKWSGMKTRVLNKNDSHYHRYGGRGILICDDWINDFKSFYDDKIPHDYEIDGQKYVVYSNIYEESFNLENQVMKHNFTSTCTRTTSNYMREIRRIKILPRRFKQKLIQD